ncbi:MAG: hypothetical protein ACLTI1_00180 [Clostridia bacterium]
MISLLESILTRKDALSRTFLRRINYAYDFQKRISRATIGRRKTLEENSHSCRYRRRSFGDNT